MVKKVRLSVLACERCSNLSGCLWGVSEQSKAGPLVATHRAPDSGSQGSGVWLHRLKWVQTVSNDAELHQTRQSRVFLLTFFFIYSFYTRQWRCHNSVSGFFVFLLRIKMPSRMAAGVTWWLNLSFSQRSELNSAFVKISE